MWVQPLQHLFSGWSCVTCFLGDLEGERPLNLFLLFPIHKAIKFGKPQTSLSRVVEESPR